MTEAVYRMQEVVQQANNATDREESAEHIALKARIAQLEELKESGSFAELERSIEALRDELTALDMPVGMPDWKGLGQLLIGGLDDATDEELRVTCLEFFERITYEGTPTAVSLKFRGLSSGDAEDGGG